MRKIAYFQSFLQKIFGFLPKYPYLCTRNHATASILTVFNSAVLCFSSGFQLSWLEQQTHNLEVLGSSPRWPTFKKDEALTSSRKCFFLFKLGHLQTILGGLEDCMYLCYSDNNKSTIEILMPLEHPILVALEHSILVTLEHPILMS